jgi:microcompartment protein CcmK/EutM
MFIAKVAGTVVATIKSPVFQSQKLLLVERLSPEGEAQEPYMIAVDTVQAGVGDTVLVLDEGNGARQVMAAENAPIRTVIVGIVDAVDVAVFATAGNP